MKHILTIETGFSILICCYQCILANISADDLDSNGSIKNSSTSGTGLSLPNSFPHHQGILENPGKNFPVFATIPETAFSCLNLETGYYADLETRCQVFHICDDGKKMSFLCPNGTIFQQSDLICDWWFKVNCTESPSLYEESSEQLKEASLRRKLARRTPLKHNILRTSTRKKEVVTSNHFKADRRNFEVDTVASSEPNKYFTSSESTNSKRRHGNSLVQENKTFTETPRRSRVNNKRFHQNNRNRTFPKIQTRSKPMENDNKNISPVYSTSNTYVKNRNVNVNVNKSTSKSPDPSNTYIRTFPKTEKLHDEFSNINKKPPMDQTNFVNIFVSSKQKVLRTNGSNKLATKNNCKFCTNSDNYKNNIVNISTKKSTVDKPLPKQLEETQITQETSNNFDSPLKVHSNHRITYKEIKEPKQFDSRYSSRIIPVNSHYLTTQSFNRGKIFIGSSVGKQIPRKEQVNSETPQTISNLRNKLNSDEVYKSQRKQNILDESSIKEFSSNSSLNARINEMIPLTIEEINSNLSNLTDTSLTNETSSLNNSGLSNAFDSIADEFERNLPLGENKNNSNNKDNIIVSTKNDPFINAIDGANGSSEDNSLNSLLKSTLFSSENPRPFDVSSTETTIIESSHNEERNSEHISLPNHFFKISTASPFTVSQMNTRNFPVGSDYSDQTESLTESINSEPTQGFSHNYKAKAMLRSGLVVPPSVSPRIIHSLAAYFENSMGNGTENRKMYQIQSDNESISTAVEDHFKSLLSNMTRHGYRKLFMKNAFVEDIKQINSSKITENTKNNTDNPENNTEVRKLAKIFSHALSEYLDDPSKFREALLSIRPTEPPNNENIFPAESELLNFSEDDSKSLLSLVFNSSVRHPLSRERTEELDEIQNSLPSDTESLSSADSQSFVSQFNNLSDTEKQNALKQNKLPNDHWTSSFEATNLWRTTFAVDPQTLNKDFQGTESYRALHPSNSKNFIDKVSLTNDPLSSNSKEEIKYELRALPKVTFNSTQLHGISIDFMNNNPVSENKFQRILHKLNVTEDEFMIKMKELEGNPITRRLVLLLIQKCDFEMPKISSEPTSISSLHPSQTLNSESEVNNHNENSRALQLLNSLYNIATKFGR